METRCCSPAGSAFVAAFLAVALPAADCEANARIEEANVIVFLIDDGNY